MQTHDEPFVPRTVCPRCRRPTSVCYCAALPTLDTKTRVVILQHPRERDMPIGTARMATLCLPGSQLHVGVRWDDHPQLAAALSDPARPAILLYPGPDARDVFTDPPSGPVTLVVVDGTWSQAKNVVRDNPVLRALPRYAFEAPELSHYRIRKEPRAEYVSTIEALMHVLGALEGDAERFRSLLTPLYAMVDAQLAAQAQRPHRPGNTRHPKGPKPPRYALPLELLTDRFEDLVVAVGEANAWPYHSYDVGSPTPRDELVHWLAHRPATGETFERVILPSRPVSPTTTFHTQLSAEQLAAGTPHAQVVEEFAAWSRPNDVVMSWGHYGLQLFTEAGGSLGERIDMRAAAQRFSSRKLGTVDNYAASFGPLPAKLGMGRGGDRLTFLAHIVRAWRDLATA